MANQVVRPVGYTGTLQQLTWAQGNNVPVSAYLWGGGGGGGGNDSGAGGSGGGGGYTRVDFTVNNGDVIQVAVGGGGGAGQSGRGNAAGGPAGASYTTSTIFSTRSATGSISVVPYSNSAYCSFLNTYGVWTAVGGVYTTYFDNTYTVNFPSSGNYTITASCDNYGTVYIDGTAVLSVPDYHYSVQTTINVSAGDHTVRLYGINTGGPGSFGATIAGGTSYSGGRGGNAGGSGSSGGGGGGGGATVVLLNNVALGAAAGGGGGGGGGNVGNRTGGNAPGTGGQGTVPAGENGQDKAGDGGGGGGGGGGLYGGNGGPTVSGDQGGLAGAYGLSSGNYSNPSGRTPGGTDSPYFRGGIATGGTNTVPGTNGYAVFDFNVPGGYVHNGVSFIPVSKTWVNNNGVWTPVNSIYVKDGGVWNQVLGGTPPTFTPVSGSFGVDSRPFVDPNPPDPMGIDPPVIF